MKKIVCNLAALLIAVTMFISADAAVGRPGRRSTKVAPVVKVTEEVNILAQIVEQATIIDQSSAENKASMRKMADAKMELRKLAHDLDSDIKDALMPDIKILLAKGKSEDSKTKARKAYERLMAAINAINAKGQVVMALDSAQIAISNASPEDQPQVAAEQLANVAALEQNAAEASWMSRAVANIKYGVTAPVDYVFGKEDSMAKTAFKAFIGGLALAGVAYAGYTYTPEGTGANISSTANKYWIKGKRFFGRPLSSQELETLQRATEADIATMQGQRTMTIEEAIAARQAERAAAASGYWSKFKNYLSPASAPKGWLETARDVTVNTVSGVGSAIGSAVTYPVRLYRGDAAAEAAAREEASWRRANEFTGILE